ncbi:MAG: ATP-binding protein [Pseudomonadota bacterium]|nr:ATP-binding protein [Gammaproteobacteria bacterium]MBU1558801.1 ATP-binding protein [Gammaproteobacteria bacterium]MBU1926849.1 ATP-binding protein [Gammaproteobacteria bacterium]MBU2546154.1 ATP-binding protein [Gammaproteobacteria bacterium]
MKRTYFLQQLHSAFNTHPIVAILGPRQCGKTTLSRQYAASQPDVTFFDLEDSRDLAKLQDPALALASLKGLVILDEIQRVPELFPILRVLIDQANRQTHYLILGSASRDLIRQSSETLAGRIEYLELTPFSFQEVGEFEKLWLRGGFPLSFLANDENTSNRWRKAYIRTFLEKDIPNLGFRIAPETLRRFWMMLAHYHANIFNASELGRSFGVAHTTIEHYLDILTGTFMVRRLRPWIENIKKRQVKAPKIYFRDSGILHTLLGIETMNHLLSNPKLGASWEGFAMEEIIRAHHAEQEACYFWSTHTGAELDLLLFQNQQRLGFEFKYSSSPKLTKSMHIALETLKLDQLTVITPGNDQYPLTDHIEVFGIEKYIDQQSF